MRTPWADRQLAPSILAADLSHVAALVGQARQGGAGWIHLDVMDGHFVPNISFGPAMVSAIAPHAQGLVMDVHLMITHPDAYLEAFAKAGAHVITVHYEACTHLHRTLSRIRELGCRAGVALNPHTPVARLEDVAGTYDLLCLMGVNPGFGGQRFIPRTRDKIARACEVLPSDVVIEVDGGVDSDNITDLVALGANILVAGSAAYRPDGPVEAISGLLGQVTGASRPDTL